MKKTLIGTNPDGSPHYDLKAEKGEHAVLTGPIAAIIETKDGTKYDVSDIAVGVPDKHLAEVLDGIHRHYEKYGHPEFVDDDGNNTFVAPPLAEVEAHCREAIKVRRSLESKGA